MKERTGSVLRWIVLSVSGEAEIIAGCIPVENGSATEQA
jgi:hypothetical protein